MKALLGTVLALAAGSLAAAALGATSGASAQSSALSGTAAPAAESDEAVYVRECALCHGPMGTGTLMLARRLGQGQDNAVLASRTNLTGPYVEYVVRHGLGSMPAITRVEVTDAQLAQIVRHLTRPQGTRR